MRAWMNVVQALDALLEAFNDLGKLSPEELRKGQRLSPSADNFKQVGGRVFYSAIRHIAANDIAKANRGLPSKGLHTLTVYSPQKYATMKCFLGANNSSGFAIAHGDQLVSVFSTAGSSGNAIMAAAIANGVRRLDCFAFRDAEGNISGPLYRLYSNHGFHIDTDMNSGTPGEAYAIQHGVSDYVDEAGIVHPDDPRVVIFMRRSASP